MKVNGLEIPASLVTDMASGRTELSSDEAQNLMGALKWAYQVPATLLASHEGLKEDNAFWGTPLARYYLGRRSREFAPGDIDPRRIISIGFIDPDTPIALDYRTSPPRVVYLGNVEGRDYWIEIAPSYEAFRTIFRP